MFHLRRNQVVGFTSKMFEKHLWKSDILSKDAGLETLVENELIISLERWFLKMTVNRF